MAYTANIDETNINRVSKFLNKADIDIVNFVIKDGKTYAIQKDENNNDVLFDFSKETSLGTKTLIAVSRFVDDALTNGKVLFVDELDTALHPHLVKYLVELFNNPETNPKGAQLIFTSHAHYLMDGEHLTRDQIWFVSKERCLAKVKKFSDGKIAIDLITDARMTSPKNKELKYMFVNTISDKGLTYLINHKTRKVELTPFGKIKKKHKVLWNGTKTAA